MVLTPWNVAHCWHIEYCEIFSNSGSVDGNLNNVHFIVHETTFTRVDFIIENLGIQNSFLYKNFTVHLKDFLTQE